MTIRCPKCGKKGIKRAMDFTKVRGDIGRYYCPNCGYLGALVWEDGDFKKVDNLPKSRWLRKRLKGK